MLTERIVINMDGFFSYVTGLINCKLIGYNGEDFFNKLISKGMYVGEVTPVKDGFTFTAKPKDYHKIKKIAKKQGISITITDRKGLPFVMDRNRHRKGIVVGFVLAVSLLYILTGRIWRIEVQGNERVDTQVIVNQLAHLGIDIGSSHRGVQVLPLEKSMLLAIDDLSFVAINLRGSTATVVVTERTVPPEILEGDFQPQNLVASQSAIIREMVIHEGQSLVKNGDTVEKGDILVSGIVEDRYGRSMLKTATGKVMGEVTQELTATISYNQEDYIPVGDGESVKYLSINGFSLPLGFVKEESPFYTVEEQEENLMIFGAKLPIALGEREYTFWTPSTITLEEEEAKDYCIMLLNQLEETKLGDAEIIERTMKGIDTGDGFKIEATYRLLVDIATPSVIYTTNN